MLNYEECKKIAVDITEKNGIPIDKAGELLDAYVFDSIIKRPIEIGEGFCGVLENGK